jgi:uncharacterized coiled-coil protein SlyX
LEKLELRVEELEVRLSFQEDLLRQLDEVIRTQADQIDGLRAEISAVREQASQDPGAAASPQEDVPPHW